MKKIGILYGNESSFQHDLINRINTKNLNGITAEFVEIGALRMDEEKKYDVILDRVSHEVPFYRSILKQSVLNGTAVVNNPYLICADDDFFHAVLANKLGIKVPKTVIIPSKEHPLGTNSDTMRNLTYPLNWEEVFNFIGFPAYIKPNIESADHNMFKVYSATEFYAAYDLTGSNVMILQESIDFDSYYRCYVIGRKFVKVMPYDPVKPWHLRFRSGTNHIEPKLAKNLENISLKICNALGFDFNSIEFAIRDGVAYAVDFMNPAPMAESGILTEDNYEWLLEATSEYLMDIANNVEKYLNTYKLCIMMSEKEKPQKTKAIAKKKNDPSSAKKRGRPAKAKE
jgi:glutathione synthase/RimK-type ligase-like ATP-grasp enzyme